MRRRRRRRKERDFIPGEGGRGPTYLLTMRFRMGEGEWGRHVIYSALKGLGGTGEKGGPTYPKKSPAEWVR